MEAMKLTDQDPMPFGKYGPRGERRTMEDVPSDYLLWLWDDEHAGMWKQEPGQPVRAYIVENFNSLETDCPDRIINHRP
jgi:hypothetical protein